MSQTAEEVSSRHPKCAVDAEEHEVVYFSEQDAFACVSCDRWLEKKCPDGEHCVFCMARPENPSDIVPP